MAAKGLSSIAGFFRIFFSGIGKLFKFFVAKAAIIFWIIAGVALGAPAGILAVKFGLLDNTPLFSEGDVTITSSQILATFTDEEKLVLQDFTFSSVGTYTKENASVWKFALPQTGATFIATYSGTISVGIENFSELDIAIDHTSKIVTATLPQVSLISRSIDPQSFEVYHEEEGIFGDIEIDDVTSFQEAQLEIFTQEALNNGILESATRHARDFVSSHITAVLSQTNAADYEVIVNIPDPDTEAALAVLTAASN